MDVLSTGHVVLATPILTHLRTASRKKDGNGKTSD
jgi:hypothetical protein